MADDADSKSVVGNHVWVQVPLPALSVEHFICSIFLFFFRNSIAVQLQRIKIQEGRYKKEDTRKKIVIFNYGKKDSL